MRVSLKLCKSLFFLFCFEEEAPCVPRQASSSLESPVFTQIPHNPSSVQSSGIPHIPPSLALKSRSVEEEWVFCCQDPFRPQCHQWVLLANAPMNLVLPGVGECGRDPRLCIQALYNFSERGPRLFAWVWLVQVQMDLLYHMYEAIVILLTLSEFVFHGIIRNTNTIFKSHLSSLLQNFIGFAASLKMVICAVVSK